MVHDSTLHLEYLARASLQQYFPPKAIPMLTLERHVTVHIVFVDTCTPAALLFLSHTHACQIPV
jgi:hypothetical protein